MPNATKTDNLFCSTRSMFDYVEVPNETWYYSRKYDELYEFDEGLFCAFPRLPDGEDHTFMKVSCLKVLPDDATIADVKASDT